MPSRTGTDQCTALHMPSPSKNFPAKCFGEQEIRHENLENRANMCIRLHCQFALFQEMLKARGLFGLDFVIDLQLDHAFGLIGFF